MSGSAGYEMPGPVRSHGAFKRQVTKEAAVPGVHQGTGGGGAGSDGGLLVG